MHTHSECVYPVPIHTCAYSCISVLCAFFFIVTSTSAYVCVCARARACVPMHMYFVLICVCVCYRASSKAWWKLPTWRWLPLTLTCIGLRSACQTTGPRVQSKPYKPSGTRTATSCCLHCSGTDINNKGPAHTVGTIQCGQRLDWRGGGSGRRMCTCTCVCAHVVRACVPHGPVTCVRVSCCLPTRLHYLFLCVCVCCFAVNASTSRCPEAYLRAHSSTCRRRYTRAPHDRRGRHGSATVLGRRIWALAGPEHRSGTSRLAARSQPHTRTHIHVCTHSGWCPPIYSFLSYTHVCVPTICEHAHTQPPHNMICRWQNLAGVFLVQALRKLFSHTTVLFCFYLTRCAPFVAGACVYSRLHEK